MKAAQRSHASPNLPVGLAESKSPPRRCRQRSHVCRPTISGTRRARCASGRRGKATSGVTMFTGRTGSKATTTGCRCAARRRCSHEASDSRFDPPDRRPSLRLSWRRIFCALRARSVAFSARRLWIWMESEMNSKLAAVNLNDPVTRHVRTDFSRLRVDQTVGEALATLRSHLPGGRVIYLYVVDGDDRLEGVIPVRRLLLSPLDTPLRDIMVTKIVSIPASATVLEACEFFTMHRLLAFPVLEAGKIVGVVDVELYTEELEHLERSERSDALFQLIGVHLTEAQQR